MLMFSKISLTAFVYDIIDIFSFPDEETRKICTIITCYIYLILTDTDSCSIQFLFLNKLNSNMTEDEARNFVFDILLLKLGQRLDTSHEFYDIFKSRNKALKKKIGLYDNL